MRVGVIGAGLIGLSAVKHSLSFGCEVIAFEQTDQIGGQWVLTKEGEKDKNGLDVHSSMYEGVRLLLPKEVMEYPDFPYKTPQNSFIGSEAVLDYIKSYAEAFDLEKHIKFEHQVVRVRPLLDDKWEFLVHNLIARKYETYIFDAVLVCNGFSVPIIPKYPGRELFEGRKMHSHSHRSSEKFTGDRVLVIGGGPSGMDMTALIGKVAEKVFWSHHMVQTLGSKLNNIILPETVTEKPDVLRFTERGAEFVDGTFEEFSTIMYATGYDFRFPFLSVDCGVSCEDKYVQPLYKHCINITRPSLAILGLPWFAVGVPFYDLQVRFCLTFMTGRKQLPSRDEMLKEAEEEMTERFKTMPKKKAHYLGLERHAMHYEDLAKTADIEPLKPVIAKIFDQTVRNIFENYGKFRDYNFKIIDDENFEMTLD